MAMTGSLKIVWQFADFSTKTTTLEPLYYDTNEGVGTDFYKARVNTVRTYITNNEAQFGGGLVSTNGAECTGISAASFTLANTTNVFNADTYEAA